MFRSRIPTYYNFKINNLNDNNLPATDQVWINWPKWMWIVPRNVSFVSFQYKFWWHFKTVSKICLTVGWICGCLSLSPPSGGYLLWVFRPPLTAAPLSQPEPPLAKGATNTPISRTPSVSCADSKEPMTGGKRQTATARGVRRGVEEEEEEVRLFSTFFFFYQNNGNADEWHQTPTYTHTQMAVSCPPCRKKYQDEYSRDTRTHTHTHAPALLLCLFCKHFRDKTSTKSPGVSLVMFWVWITTADKAVGNSVGGRKTIREQVGWNEER